jgi:hypothetical protein
MSDPITNAPELISFIRNLTDADTSRTTPPVSDYMSILASEKPLVLFHYFEATRRIRTDDLLITNAKKSGPETSR